MCIHTGDLRFLVSSEGHLEEPVQNWCSREISGQPFCAEITQSSLMNALWCNCDTPAVFTSVKKKCQAVRNSEKPAQS